MAIIRDMISGFELFQPTEVDDAIELLSRYGDDGWVLSGGLDSFDWFKDRIKKPTAVVDLGNVEELKGVRTGPEGVEIGAMTTITEVARHPHLIDNYTVLTEAANHIATPQIRNRGTLGGNLSQDTRCWYYRSGWPCYRAGGNVCYAGTPTSMNREHCITGASRCVAVNPSDSAPALISLGAQFVIKGPKGERVVEAQDYFMSPAVDIERMTILNPGELLTSILLLSLELIGPFPSIGLPKPSTTRPNSSLPTGTSTISPVRFTVSPSLMPVSTPKILTPTLSISRLSAIPLMPPGNSIISPA